MKQAMPAASRRCLMSSAIASLPACSTVTNSLMSASQRGREVVDRGLLGGADLRAVLLMALGDPAGQREDELAVVLDLVRGRLALQRRHGLLQHLHRVAPELVVGVKAGVIALGL